MADLHVDRELLRRFEAGFDPRRPERSAIPARVLKQGRVSTVLAIEQDALAKLAFKRLALFRSAAEAEHYEALHRRYVRTLGERIGLRVMPSMIVRLDDAAPGRIILYIVQEQALEDATGHWAIYRLSPNDVNRLLLGVLAEAARVFDFNQQHRGTQELGFDLRLSNWTILGFDPERPFLPERHRLAYLDTSTPLMRRNGRELLDMDIFLRSMPAYIPGFVRRSVLSDFASRYYDFRRAVVDLIADLHSEGRADLIPWLTDTVNWFFLAERNAEHFQPLTVTEVNAYHRRDMRYWQTYTALRRLVRVVRG